MINVVIPMAGKSSRFFDAGYKFAKALLPVNGKTMIQAVIDNLKYKDAIYTIVINKNQLNKQDLNLDPSINIIEIDYVPSGPAISAMIAMRSIDVSLPLIITNCDQIIEDLNMELFIDYCEYNNLDGCLGTFFSNSNKNSYVRLNGNNEIIELKEKEVISNVATNGFHYWETGYLFITSVIEMVENGDSVNGEYYIAPSYNYLIKNGKKIMPYWFNMHFPIGIPEDYKNYLKKNGNI